MLSIINIFYTSFLFFLNIIFKNSKLIKTELIIIISYIVNTYYNIFTPIIIKKNSSK